MHFARFLVHKKAAAADNEKGDEEEAKKHESQQLGERERRLPRSATLNSLILR